MSVLQAQPWLPLAGLCCLMAAGAAALWLARPPGRRVRLLVLLLAVVCSVRYLLWQAVATTTWLRDLYAAAAQQMAAAQTAIAVLRAIAALLSGLPSLLLLAAAAWVLGCLVVRCGLQIRPLRRKPVALPDESPLWPAVDVLIRAGQESLDTIRTTVLASRQMDWPPDRLHVFVVEAEHREAVRSFCAEVGCSYLAGEGCDAAVPPRWALERFGSPFLALLRTDHIPVRSLLQVTMGSMVQDARLAVVQTACPQGAHRGFVTQDPARWNERQDGLDFWGRADLAGTAAVIRRAAWAVVERADPATAEVQGLRFKESGWRTAFLRAPQVAGATPETATDRHGGGNGQGKVSWSCVVFLVVPALYLLLGCVTLPGPAAELVAFAVPMLVFARAADRLLADDGPGGTPPVALKQRRGPALVLAALNGAAVVSGATEGVFLLRNRVPGDERAPLAMLAIQLVWAVLNLAVLGAPLRASFAPPQRRRRALRIPLHAPVTVRPAGQGAGLRGVTGDVSKDGALILLEDGPGRWQGAPITVTFEQQPEGEVFLPATVVATEERALRVQFGKVPLGEESSLTRLLYGRADRWIQRSASVQGRAWRVAESWSGYGLLWRELTASSWISLWGRLGLASLALFCSLCAAWAGQHRVQGRQEDRRLWERQAAVQRSWAQSAGGRGAVARHDTRRNRVSLGGALLLRGAGDRAERGFATSAAEVQQRARMFLQFRCGGGAQGGALWISLNDVAVEQVPLMDCDTQDAVERTARKSRSRSAVIELPPELLVTSNQVGFALAGGPACNRSRSKTIWLQVEAASALQMEALLLRPRSEAVETRPPPEKLKLTGEKLRSLLACLGACVVLVWPLDALIEWKARARLHTRASTAL